LGHLILIKWTKKAPMPTAGGHLTSSGVNGKVYSSGGRSNGMYFNVDSNEVYDITINGLHLN